MVEIALALVALGFLAMIAVEAERTMNDVASLRHQIIRDSKEPARPGRHS
ncbi:hypothetical protein ACO2RV_01080 [Ancylobacter sp. VNQ12]